jgi:transcriptional regulator with XRE-family HTH domain
MPYERIALALKHDMAKRGIDQTSLGEAIGLTQQAVSGWLQDKKGIRTKSLRLLADYFGPASECAALLARTKTKQEYTPAAPANSAPREKYDIPPATAPLHVSDNRVEYTSM